MRGYGLFFFGFAMLLLAVIVAPHLVQAAPAGWPADAQHLRDNAIVVEVDVSTATDTTLVAAASGVQYQVIGFFFQSEGTQAGVFFKSGSTTLTGPVEFVDGDTWSMGINDAPINCARGEALVLTTSSAVQLNGHVVYVKR